MPGSFFLPNLLAAGFQEADWYGLSCNTSTGWDAATYPTSEGYTLVLYPSAKGHIVKTLVHEFTHVHFNSLGFKQDFDTDSGTGPFAYQRRILITRERGDTHEMLDVVEEQNAVGRPIGQADQVGEALSSIRRGTCCGWLSLALPSMEWAASTQKSVRRPLLAWWVSTRSATPLALVVRRGRCVPALTSKLLSSPCLRVNV